MGTLISYVVVGVVSFVLGILVYRNNVKDIGPIADKFDEKIAPLVDEINELKKKVK